MPEKITEKDLKSELEKNNDQAEALLANEDKLEEFLLKLEKKLKVVPGLGDALAVVPTMISLVRSYAKKEYTELPLGTVISIISALIYFLSPIDLIPDAVPGVGQLDDAAMILACVKWVKDDINSYEKWRAENKPKAKSDAKALTK